MKFNVKKTEQKGMGICAKGNIPAYSVISDIKYVREATRDNPLSESEKHFRDHLHSWSLKRTSL